MRVHALLAPSVLALALYVPLLVVFLAVPITFFEREDVTTKYASWEGAVFYAVAIVVFALGSVVGGWLPQRSDRAGKRRPDDPTAAIGRICTVALLLALAGYGLWFGLAIARAGGPLALLETYRSDPALVANDYFASIAGLTTLAKLAIGAIPLAIAYGLIRRRSTAVLIVVTLAAAALVSVFASERLAILELLIPIAYLVVADRRTTPAGLAAGAVLVVGGLAAFFVASEIARTGAYVSFSPGDAAYRFFAYYVSSINNSFAVAQHYSLATPLYFSTQAIWEFPGAAHAGLTYENVFGIDARTLYADFFRANAITPRVTTLGLPGQAAADFGWSAPFATLGLGAAVGAVHRAAEWSPFSRALYAVLMVGILDFVRTDYFVATRVVPAYLVFAAAFFLTTRIRD